MNSRPIKTIISEGFINEMIEERLVMMGFWNGDKIEGNPVARLGKYRPDLKTFELEINPGAKASEDREEAKIQIKNAKNSSQKP